MSNRSKTQAYELRKHVCGGFVYKREKLSRDGSRIFWYCVQKIKPNEKCRGRVHTTSDGERTFIKLASEHNCSYKGSGNPSLQIGEHEAKKRALYETQRVPRQARPEEKNWGDPNLAPVIGTYAASVSSVDDLFELVQRDVGDKPIDFTNLNELQHPIFIKEMARKIDKLSLDFEQTECSRCCYCGKRIDKISTENLAIKRDSRVWHRIMQTANRDSECASLAIHTFLYHSSELWPTLRCLFGSEIDALNCYPYLDYRTSSPKLFICFICRQNYTELISFIRHSETHHEEILGKL